MTVAVLSAVALRALAVQMAEILQQQQRETEEARWVNEVAFAANGLEYLSELSNIDQQEQAEMWRRRRGPFNWRKGHRVYYKSFILARVLANRRQLKREQRACKQAVTDHIKRTTSGLFPGTSFQLRFRF